MTMKNVVLVGVGGIGFRHFQAILNYSDPINLYVIDLREEAILRCREEEKSNDSNVLVYYSSELTELPKVIDILIIATSSIPRCGIFKRVVGISSVKNVVFEKFLFPKLDEYDEVSVIIKEMNISAFVNCPGRMYPGYKELKKEIDKSKGGNVFISGSDWGLSCNTIHFVDQVGFLFESYDDLHIDISLLDRKVKESRRNGYVEFTGRILATLGDRINLVIDSFDEGKIPLRITIINGANTFTISESEGWILTEKNGVLVKEDFEIKFQSQLTDTIIAELLNGNGCELTAYENTKQWHKELLSAFIDLRLNIDSNNKSMCPIT